MRVNVVNNVYKIEGHVGEEHLLETYYDKDVEIEWDGRAMGDLVTISPVFLKFKNLRMTFRIGKVLGRDQLQVKNELHERFPSRIVFLVS
jgi:hypothetical protein